MDLLTTDLLVKWGLCEYVDRFRDGKIDSGTLRLLGDDEISQLIPVPGDRARFKANLKNWKEELSCLNNVVTEDPLLSNASLSTLIRETSEIVDANDTNFDAPGTPYLTSREFDAPATHHLTSREFVTQRQKDFSSLRPSSPYLISPGSPNLTSREFQEDFVSATPSTSKQYTEDTPHRIISPLRSKSPINTSQTQGYVFNTLNSTRDGKAILGRRSKGILDESQRNLLVKLLINPLFETDPHCHISNTQLLSWSLEIQQIFEKESSALYYTPYVAPLVHVTARNASGKLLRYVYNKRRQLRERGIIESSNRSRSSSRSSSSTVSVAPLISLKCATAEANEEVEQKLNWLRNSLEPWHLVQENWMTTANYRLSHIYLAGGTIQEYFNEYAVLKRPAGYHLLLDDFKCLYEGKSDAFFNNIVILREKIIQLAKKKATYIKDKDIKQTIENYLNTTSENNNDPDVCNNGALLLLPYISSSVPIKQKKKGSWKPSKAEIRDGFITQIGSDSELETTISARREKLKNYGKTLQPFVVFVGQSIASVLHCYVVAGDTYYRINNLSSAVDICFKIIHATGAKYQEECLVIWMIIQKAFYNINTPYDKDLTTVKSLLIDLGL